MYSDGKRSGVRMRRRLGLPTAPKLLALIVPYLCRCVSIAKMDSVELVTLTLGLGLGLGRGLGEGPPQARLAAVLGIPQHDTQHLGAVRSTRTEEQTCRHTGLIPNANFDPNS